MRYVLLLVPVVLLAGPPVVGRGGEVQFDRNAMMDIRFGARPPAGKKLLGAVRR